MKRKLLILGNSYMNLEMLVRPIDKKGDVTPGGKYGFHPYGPSPAAAITAAKMGADCILCTKIADDMNGERLKKYYKATGIGTSMISTVKGAQTGMSFTAYEEGGSGEHFVSDGANRFFTKSDVDEAFSTFPDYFIIPQDELYYVNAPATKKATEPAPESVEEILIDNLNFTSTVSTPIPKSISDADEIINAKPVEDPRGRDSLALYACNKAMEKKVDMILDYDSAASSLPLSEFTGIKVVIISEETLRKMTGAYQVSDDAIKRSLLALQSIVQSRYYVVQMGSDTAFVYDGNAYEKIYAPECMKELAKNSPPKMRETYVGAFAAEYLSTKNIVRACTYAVIVSLLTRSHDGVLEHIPTKEEVENYIKTNKINTMKW